jgi:hypothetical protein
MKHLNLLICAATTLVVTTVQATQEQLALSIKEARVEATRTAEQLKSTLNALNALTKQKEGDLRPAYNAFAVEIPRTESAADWTRTRVKWMESDGQQYFKNWQNTIDGIANESLRKKAQKRLNSARKSYDKVSVSLKDGAEKFRPFLSNLADVQKGLSADVTAGGVKAVKGTVSDANWSYKGVNKAINDALSEMAKMEKALSTEAN